MKKILSIIILLLFNSLSVFAYTVDNSIDADIRKNYNTGAIEKDLLPKLPATEPNISKIITNISKDSNRQYKEIKIPQGATFKVRSMSSISSSSVRGTKVSFVSTMPEPTRYLTIPKGTVFVGDISNSHPPQLSGNGGLIELKIDEMKYKGYSYPVKSKISIANHKRIFLNNIKGKRKYISNVKKVTRPGSNFLGKTWQVTCRLAHGPEILFSPFPIAGGVVVYAANAIISPILSIFYTGDSITIPAQSYFEIKLIEDIVIVDY